tara:strand:- start:151 stop:1893 length:1743 start_codon:yes stop_codon:yes gene_type:complete
MASSYVNDLRLEEIGTGEQSGTWGATTNTNLELIGEAFGYGTEGITTNADTHTSTIADGATDPVRAMFVKYTGTLDSACTITIAPNTVNRMQFIENATSGSQNIIISQGSGANITIPAGDVKAVYLDGAGSGAAVVDAFASLSVVDLKVQDDLTVTGDLDVDGTTNLDAVDIDGAVQIDGTVTVGVDDTGLDVKFFGATSGAYMLWDESADDLKLVGAAGLTVAGDIDIDGTTNLDAVDIDGAVQIDGTVTVGVDDTGLDVKFFGATSGAYMLWDESADDLKLVGAAGLTVAGDIDVDGTTNLDAVDIDGAVQLDSTLSVGVDGTGHDVKFFGDTASAYMLWDQSTDDLILGGASRLGVGTTTPGAPLNVRVTADGTLVRLGRSGVCDWDVSIGNTSTLSGVGSGALEFLPQNSGTPNEFAIGKAGTTVSLFHATIDGITMSQQPAFQVRPASTQTNIATGSEITVVFGTEVFDVGANFASNTFTAPVTGKYQLNLSLYTNALDTASDYYIVAIKTSNRQYDNVIDGDGLAADPVYWNQGLSVLADMDANDTAHVFIQQANGTAQTDVATGSVFSGFLAC